MNDYVSVNKILHDVKALNIVLVGCKSEKLFKSILKYIKSNSGKLVIIDSQPKININKFLFENKGYINFYKEDSLNKLDEFKDYDAIFIDGNPNWYTVFSELNIIESNCKEFPLIFVCNAVFPNKRRDTYYYFDNIPSSYVHINSKKLIILQDFEDRSKIVIDDENYHALYSNSEKNGVLTAIDDFIQKTTLTVDKTLVDSNTGILLLYFKNHDLFKRFSKLNNSDELCDLKIINHYLTSFIIKLLAEKSDSFYKNHYNYIINQLIEYKSINKDLNDLLISKEVLLNFKDELIKSNNEILNSKDNLIKYDNISIGLLKNYKFRIFSIFFSYLYIIYKFKFDNIKLNLKLFSIMVDKNWLNIGFYLENNKDLSISKWFKILTPEAHYICNGYYEGRLPYPNFKRKTNKERLIKEIMEDFND